MAKSTFQRRGMIGGVFACGICGRRTRHTNQGMAHLCPQCDEWTASENSINDGNYAGCPPEDLAQAEAAILKLKREAWKRGGDAASLGLTPDGTRDLRTEINAVTMAAVVRGYRLEIAGGALPGESALVVDLNGDAVEEPDEPLAALAQLYALLVDLREGVITAQQFDDLGGSTCHEILKQSQA
ncbi:hypothetical protein [Burkholderia vietnamiensis]|uniref:hypothetical protein n=1 Tax=Burkholderia vietnamiensis TaxID=60552 RepID=UPI001CF4242A|nr:hypothetical protein [Burkholderia vietnamiensis]MCA8148173.1 hypothetical protein [Burkholderia vietnamiensis]